MENAPKEGWEFDYMTPAENVVGTENNEVGVSVSHEKSEVVVNYSSNVNAPMEFVIFVQDSEMSYTANDIIDLNETYANTLPDLKDEKDGVHFSLENGESADFVLRKGSTYVISEVPLEGDVVSVDGDTVGVADDVTTLNFEAERSPALETEKETETETETKTETKPEIETGEPAVEETPKIETET